MFRVMAAGQDPILTPCYGGALWRARDLIYAGAATVRLYLGERLIREWVRRWVN